MRYLVAAPLPGEYGQDMLNDGDPVVPAFPIGECNHFVGAKREGTVQQARAAELAEDPDKLLAVFCAQYPGMPKKLLEDMLFNVVKVASTLDPLDRFRVFVQPQSAVLHSTIDEELTPLWENLDTYKYL